MTNKEILQKVIIKARKNSMYDNIIDDYNYVDINNIAEHLINDKQVERITFSHDFAKAFWGKQDMFAGNFEFDYWETPDGFLNEKYSKIEMPTWQYHLQQMVLEEEPLKYLEKFL